jgi:hypothetical protein
MDKNFIFQRYVASEVNSASESLEAVRKIFSDNEGANILIQGKIEFILAQIEELKLLISEKGS